MQKYQNANNSVTSTYNHPPDKEERPTQNKTQHRARRATSSAAQGGTKSAERIDGHARANAASQHETRAHFKAVRQKPKSASKPAPLPMSTPGKTASSQQLRGLKHGRRQAAAKAATALVGAVTVAKTVSPSTWHSHFAPMMPHQFPRPDCYIIKKAPQRRFSTVF